MYKYSTVYINVCTGTVYLEIIYGTFKMFILYKAIGLNHVCHSVVCIIFDYIRGGCRIIIEIYENADTAETMCAILNWILPI